MEAFRIYDTMRGFVEKLILFRFFPFSLRSFKGSKTAQFHTPLSFEATPTSALTQKRQTLTAVNLFSLQFDPKISWNRLGLRFGGCRCSAHCSEPISKEVKEQTWNWTSHKTELNEKKPFFAKSSVRKKPPSQGLSGQDDNKSHAHKGRYWTSVVVAWVEDQPEGGPITLEEYFKEQEKHVVKGAMDVEVIFDTFKFVKNWLLFCYRISRFARSFIQKVSQFLDQVTSHHRHDWGCDPVQNLFET